MSNFARAVTLFLLMFGAVAASIALTPKPVPRNPTDSVRLDEQIPREFGQWQVEKDVVQSIVSPQVAKTLNLIYSDTLSRTYINAAGERIMLSVAYGTNQSRDLQIHKPEVCYAAQGFQIRSQEKVRITLQQDEIPAMRIIAFLGNRTEPITYWIRSGDDLVRGWYEQNRSRVSSGLKGVINDGLLVRVSSISGNPASAFAVQEGFIREMLMAIPPAYQHMFLGSRQQ